MEDHEVARNSADGRELGWTNTKDAAELLGITTRTLYRFIDEGQVPAYKFGRVIRLRRKDIDDFIEASRVTPGSLSNLYPPRKGGEES